MAAGPVMQEVVHHHANPMEFKSATVGAAILVLVLCAGPPLIFVGRLIQERHRGGLRYGALEMRMGARFGRKWLNPRLRLEQSALDVSDFAGTNAMYSIAANTQGLQILPLELKNVGLLIVATCLPFVPVWLLAVPFDEIAKRLSFFLL